MSKRVAFFEFPVFQCCVWNTGLVNYAYRYAYCQDKLHKMTGILPTWTVV